MKALRVITFIVCGLAIVLVAVVVLAFVPAVQTWAVRKAVTGRPGLTVEVDRVAAGLSSATVSGLKVIKDGMVITADRVSASYSVRDYLAHKRISVDSAAVQGLVADLRRATEAPAPASTPATAPVTTTKTPPSPFSGILSLAQLPMDLRVAKVTAEGRVLLPAERVATFTVQGSDIETAKEGKLSWKVDFSDAGKNVPLASAQTTGTATVHITSDRRIDVVTAEASGSARGVNIPSNTVRLTLKAQQATAGGNEVYELHIGLVSQQGVEPLASSRVEYQSAARTLAGTWEVSVGSGQFVSFAELGLPDVAAKGSGQFTFTPGSNRLSASGGLQADISSLEKLSPALAALGALSVQSTFDGSLDGEIARLSRMELFLTDAGQRKLAEISALQNVAFDTSKQRVVLADPKAPLARIAVQNLPLAWFQSLAKPLTLDSGDLSLVISVEADADGSHVAVKSVEPVTLRSVTVRNGSKMLVEKASLLFQPQVIYSSGTITAEIASLKLSMPAGDTIEGAASVKVTRFWATPIIAFSTKLQGKLNAALKPYLPLDPGPLTFVTAADGQLEGQKVRLTHASTKVDRAASALLLAVETQQALDADLKSLAVSLPNADAPAARIRLGEIPLSWCEAFLAKSKFGGSLIGGALDVSLRSLDELSIKSAEPIVLRAVSVTLDQQALAQDLDITTDFSATKRGEIIGYDVRQLELKQGDVPLAKAVVAGQAKLGSETTLSAQGNLDADLAAVSRQPALASFALLAKGNLAVTFDVTSGKAIQAKASVKLSNLVAKQNNQALGSLETTLDANVSTDGSGRIKLPLVFVANNRRSDLTLDGSITRGPSLVSFDGKLESEQLFLDDFKALAGLAPASTNTSAPAAKPPTPPGRSPTSGPAPKPAPAPPAKRDTAPFWRGIAGKFEANFKKVQLGPDYPITGIKGRFAITETRLAIETLEGSLKANPFKATGGLAFATEQAKPYTLSANATVSNFDVGEFLRATSPAEKPLLESKVSVMAKLAGSGGNLGELIETTHGQFEASGTAGVFRPLGGDKGRLIGGTGALLGLAGALSGSQNTAALGQLFGKLEEMKFDRFSMQVDRAADLAIKISALEFVSPDTRLTGTGRIDYRASVPPADWPLHMDLQLGGKAGMARLLGEVNVLSGKQDAQGYSLMSTPMVIVGTVGKPNSDQVRSFIREQATKAALSGLGRLLK